MGEVVHTSCISIVREKGPTRKAIIEGFSEPVYYGVHSGIKRFYDVQPEKEYPATRWPEKGSRHLRTSTGLKSRGTLRT